MGSLIVATDMLRTNVNHHHVQRMQLAQTDSSAVKVLTQTINYF